MKQTKNLTIWFDENSNIDKGFLFVRIEKKGTKRQHQAKLWKVNPLYINDEIKNALRSLNFCLVLEQETKEQQAQDNTIIRTNHQEIDKQIKEESKKEDCSLSLRDRQY